MKKINKEELLKMPVNTLFSKEYYEYKPTSFYILDEVDIDNNDYRATCVRLYEDDFKTFWSCVDVSSNFVSEWDRESDKSYGVTNYIVYNQEDIQKIKDLVNKIKGF